MRKHLANFALFFAIFFINISNGYSQSSADTASQASNAVAMEVYHQALSPENNLYNGREYAYNFYYPFAINEGHPFFFSKDFSNGKVVYNNILFENIPLLFDIIHDELLVRNPGGQYIISLNMNNVQWFDVWNHKFVRLTSDSAENRIRTGFYDVLYNGKTSLYKKAIKEIKENNSSSKYVTEADRYFIKKDNSYFEIKNKKNILLVLKDKKKELTQFIRKNHLNIKKQKDDSFAKIVAYYNTLNT